MIDHGPHTSAVASVCRVFLAARGAESSDLRPSGLHTWAVSGGTYNLAGLPATGLKTASRGSWQAKKVVSEVSTALMDSCYSAGWGPAPTRMARKAGT